MFNSNFTQALRKTINLSSRNRFNFLRKLTQAHRPLWRNEWQHECWTSYLSSGRGSEELFSSIDLDESGTISLSELKFFVESLHKQGIHPRGMKFLKEIAHDHQITEEEFKSWLVLATKFCEEKNSNYLLRYNEMEQASKEKEYSWNQNTMSQAVRKMQYAVRGEIVMKAETMASEGKEILYTNVGNPQAVGQKPNTYYRQVMALCDLPSDVGVDNQEIGKIFPQDVIEQAKSIQLKIGSCGTGAYTGSQGVLGFRQDVAKFIEERDGHPSNPGNIFLTNGASSAIDLAVTTLISENNDAVMIPIPQYPIYSAILARLGSRQVGYYLDEEANWSVSESELETKLSEAVGNDSLNVKALVIINPGNPTGKVFSRSDLETICRFCAKHGIVLLADEVYQKNVYTPSKKFVSAKKVALETPECKNLQLISFHSTSKGVIGECGRRGGYMELHHIDPYVQSQLYKLASSGLCSNVPGQIMTSLMVSPPQKGELSYQQFMKEEKEIFDSLEKKSNLLVDGLNAIEGIECNSVEGAMYAFPRLINLPKKSIDKAEEKDMSVDTFYAMSLLEETGVCVVPASGFGQRDGRYGFRTTFLLPEKKMLKVIEEIAHHHKLFCQKYA